MDIEFILSSPKGRANTRYIKKNYPDEYINIMQCCGSSFPEKLYNYFYNHPQHVCPTCGKQTPFRNILQGYSQFCSVKCSYSSDIRLNKIKNTMLEKYGVENASQSEIIKRKKEETCLKNYGVTSWLKNPENSKKKMLEKYGVENASYLETSKQKREETCLKNHGVTNILKLQDIRSLGQNILLEKYGVKYAFESEEIRRKAIDERREQFLGTWDLHIGYDDDGNWICKCPHENCNKCSEKTFVINQVMFHDRIRNESELCTKLLLPGQSNQGTTIELFIRNILDEYNIEYETNVRNIISPKELDIYIPLKNIAIECNGLFWHSKKEPSYHSNKFQLCKNNNIQLITLWEDWIRTNPEIVRSILLSKLGIYENKIYARKCIIKEVDSKTCNTFLNNNHIQGRSTSSLRFGLYYNNELVSIMTFSKSRVGIGKNEEGWELVRFCNKKNNLIIGGASKLFKYFIKHYNPSKVVSYSSNDISNGNLYKILGFNQQNKINQSYWYIHNKTFERYHRFNFRKDNLKKMGYDISNKTESEIMKDLPYWKIYDSGTIRWEWIYR